MKRSLVERQWNCKTGVMYPHNKITYTMRLDAATYMSPQQNHIQDTRCDLTLWHVPETKSHTWHKMWLDAAAWPWDKIYIHDTRCDLTLRHVAVALVTNQEGVASKAPNMCATFCHWNMSHEFKLIWIPATSHGSDFHRNIHVTLGDLSWRHVTSCDSSVTPLLTSQSKLPT